MRPFHFFIGALAVGIGLAGWATLGQAQPGSPKPPPLPDPSAPIPGLKSPRPLDPIPERPAPRPKPVDEFADLPSLPSTPGTEKPPVRAPKVPEPVRVLDQIELPDVKLPDTKPTLKPTPVKDPPAAPMVIDIKPELVVPAPKVEAPVRPITRVSAGGPDLDPRLAPTGPAAKQDPSVSLQWFGPTVVKAGQPLEFSLVARNTSAIALHKVIVQVRVPEGCQIMSVEPKHEGTEKVLLWDLGTMAPRDDKTVKMKFQPPAKGEINLQGWVTFTGSASVKVQVREPKLQVKVQAPPKLMVGDAANLVMAIANSGDFPAEQVKLAVVLGEGLETARGATGAFDIGTLAAGETRQVTIPCVAKSAGAQKLEATVEGDGGLKAVDAGNVNVVQPRLEVEMTGPKLRYLDRKAQYVMKVTNPGDAPATNVSVAVLIPGGLKFVSADANGQLDSPTRSVKWVVGEIAAGETKELKCELVASSVGDFTVTASVVGARGARAEKSVTTKVEGLSALLMEVVDTDDPLEVGADTTYEIRITNTGSKDEPDVKLTCTIPPQFKFKSATGPVKHTIVGNEVVFTTLAKLPTRTDATFKLTLTAVQKGDARFKATLMSGGLSEPVTKQESTRVYAD